MCFPDAFEKDDSDDLRKRLSELFGQGEFDETSATIRMFGVNMDVPALQLACGMLSYLGSMNACVDAIKVAGQLRNLIGNIRVAASAASCSWNRQFNVGQLVQIWPAGRNGDSFLTRTASTAFDTPTGSYVVVDDHHEAVSLPELAETKAAATLKDYRGFFAHWRRITGDPPMCDVTRDDLYAFRERLLKDSWTDERGKVHPPVSPKTVEKHHGYFRFFFTNAVNLGIIEQVPQLYVFRKSVLSSEQARARSKKARDVIGPDEMIRLFHGCAQARYPFKERGRKISGEYRCLLWRSMLYFAWLYGIRQSDLKSLRWDCFTLKTQNCAPHGMLLFAPWKLRHKGRLQGLPLTALCRAILELLEVKRRQFAGSESETLTGPLFPFMGSKSGAWNTPQDGREPHWVEGWSSTLQRDICASQGILPTFGPEWMLKDTLNRADHLPAITLHVFRQTAVTQYNDFRSDTGRRIGRFIAGHTGGAVDEQSYDKPTAAVWDAIRDREQTQLPAIWRDWFTQQGTAAQGGTRLELERSEGDRRPAPVVTSEFTTGELAAIIGCKSFTVRAYMFRADLPYANRSGTNCRVSHANAVRLCRFMAEQGKTRNQRDGAMEFLRKAGAPMADIPAAAPCVEPQVNHSEGLRAHNLTEFWTTADLCAVFGASPPTVRRWILRAGLIYGPVVVLSRANAMTLFRFVAEHGHKASIRHRATAALVKLCAPSSDIDEGSGLGESQRAGK